MDTLVPVEDTTLESWLDEELPCQFDHRAKATTCTVHVTHRVITCVREGNVCDAAAQYASATLRECEAKNMKCAACKRLCVECWAVIPI